MEKSELQRAENDIGGNDKNSAEAEDYLMDSLLHDDSSHLPLLSLINLLAVETDTDRGFHRSKLAA